MDENRKGILELNEDCQLEIMKYIIAACEVTEKPQRHKMQYEDLVNFALAHEDFEGILKEHYKALYDDLELVFVANRYRLELDFSELQTKAAGKGGDAFWRVFGDAIRENDVLDEIQLNFNPKYYQPDFLDHFEGIKRALERKKRLRFVRIALNGYSLEDLNRFGHITNLDLCVRMSAEALVEVCKSNPHLRSLAFQSTEMLGRLSDIVPHCGNLQCLEFARKRDVDIAEYAPLAELPNLGEMSILGAFEMGSLLTVFEAISKWQRPGLQPLIVTFKDGFPHPSIVTIARIDSLILLKMRDNPHGIQLSVSYDFWDMSGNSSPLEQSLADITLIEASFDMRYRQLDLSKCPTSDTDISGLTSLLKVFNVRTFSLEDKGDEVPIAKIFASMASDESLALKWIYTVGRDLDQFNTAALLKIKSIAHLTCTFSDWESVELLSGLVNLQTLNIRVENDFEKMYSEALCRLLSTCSSCGAIECPDWRIEFLKNGNALGQNKRVKTLKIGSEELKRKSDIFEALGHRDLIEIEELDVAEYWHISVKDILTVAEVQPITKLNILLTDAKDPENLSDLTELEELVICGSGQGSLTKLFEQLATKASLQSLKINSAELSGEELVRVSRIRSLRKLDLCGSPLEDCSALMEQANSNIEELTLASPRFSLGPLFSAFAAGTTNGLRHLAVNGAQHRIIDILALEELSKMKGLRSFQCRCLCNNISLLRNLKHLAKLDIALIVEIPQELPFLAELGNLESLTLLLDDYKDVCSLLNANNVLADIKSLRKLCLIVLTDVKFTNIYRAFASKSVKLTHLTTAVGCVEEVSEITRIKSLQNLKLFFKRSRSKLTSLGELPELKSLKIALADWYNLDAARDRVISLLKCCRNLDFLSFNFTRLFMDSPLLDIYALLKSIRDPTVQGPLTIILTNLQDVLEFYEEYNLPKILTSVRYPKELNNNKSSLCQLIRFENAYFRVLD